MAIPWLTSTLGANAKLRVRVQNAAGPGYLDITDKVRDVEGLEVTRGRQDEFTEAQPSQAKFVVDNSTFLFAYGQQSPIWPYNRIGAYVSIQATLDSVTYYPLFEGEVAAITPTWDETGRLQLAEIECAGTLRRLIQGQPPQPSLMRSFFTSTHPTDVVGYWPLEESEGAVNYAPADWHHSTLPVYMGVKSGAPEPGGSDEFLSSRPVVRLNEGQLEANLYGQYSTFGKYQLSFAVSVPTGGSDDLTPLAIMVMGSDSNLGTIEVEYLATPAIAIRARNKSGGTVYNQSVGIGLNGNPGVLMVKFSQVTGTTVSVDVSFVNIAGSVGGASLVTMTSAILGTVRQLRIGANGFHENVGIGHVMLRTATFNDIVDFTNAASGFRGELSNARITRLCAENGIGIQFGFTYNFGMGAQRPAGLLDQFREVETMQMGMLFDGFTSGAVALRGIPSFENQAASITLDASSRHVGLPFEVTNDDQGRINVCEVDDINGSTEVVEQTQGNLKPSDVGVYATSMELNRNPGSSLRVADVAGRQVSLGTVEGYRHREVTIDVGNNPSFAAWAMQARPGHRIDITNLRSKIPGYPPGTVKLTVQGWTHSITNKQWLMTLHTTPFEPNHIFVIAAPSGDTDEFLGRVDTSESTLASGISAGATSMSVASSGSILWTTAADDFPLVVDVGGQPVTVTNITGTSSPQTFTVTGSTVVWAVASGTPVTVWQPGRLRA